MNKSDKNKFKIAFYLIGSLIFILLINFVFKMMNPLYIIGSILVLQQVYIVPSVVSKFYKFNSVVPNKIVLFIPMLNECQILNPAHSIIVIITGCMSYIFFILGLLDTSLFVGIIGESVGIDLPFYMIFCGFIFYVIMCIVRGLAYIKIHRHIDERQTEITGISSKVDAYSYISYAYYLFYMIPLFRIISLTFLSNKLLMMVTINKYNRYTTRETNKLVEVK